MWVVFLMVISFSTIMLNLVLLYFYHDRIILHNLGKRITGITLLLAIVMWWSLAASFNEVIKSVRAEKPTKYVPVTHTVYKKK